MSELSDLDLQLLELEIPASFYFEGDMMKVHLWMTMPNIHLKFMSPAELARAGRAERIKKMIEDHDCVR